MRSIVRLGDRWLVLGPLLSIGDESVTLVATSTPRSATSEVDSDDGPASAGPPTFASGLDHLSPNEQLEQLVELHGEAVYRVALSVMRDPSSAEDVTQESLIKAWQALPSYRGEAPLRSWLLRIAHNTAVSAIRRRREDPLDPSLIPENSVGRRATSDGTESAVERRAAMEAFEAALDNLDELSRSITVLRELEGMSYDEIASLLDVPLPTVKTRLLRARRLLSNTLEGWRP